MSTGAAQVEGVRAEPVRYPEYRETGALARGLNGWSPLVLALIALLILLIVPPFYFLLKTSLYTTNADGSVTLNSSASPFVAGIDFSNPGGTFVGDLTAFSLDYNFAAGCPSGVPKLAIGTPRGTISISLVPSSPP